MAEYINIKGQNIEVVASDPANPTIGQIWYNSTSNTLKGYVYQAAAWASSGNMNSGRYFLASGGTQTATLAAGGSTSTPVGPGITGATEEYNGATWASNPTGLNTARFGVGGAGTQSAGLAFGGSGPPITGATEEYDGSTWTTVPPGLNTARNYVTGIGTQTAGLAFSGDLPGLTTATEEYNGATWASSNPMITARVYRSSWNINCSDCFRRC
jgi:hypothetical protein